MEPTAPILPEPELLDRLVTLVDASLADAGWYHPHVLVKIEAPTDLDGIELGMKPLPEGSHPVDELWGFVAPEEWSAIGLVTYGWASPPDRGRPSTHPDRLRVRLTVVVDRDGNEAQTASFEDGSVIDENGEGRVSDVLRLCIGAPTAPPPPVGELADVLWLMAVVEASSPRRIGWPTISSLRAEPAGRTTTWAGMRAMAAMTEQWRGADTWMDDGFFARELLAWLPSIDESMAVLERRLTKLAIRKIRAVLG